MSSPCLPAGTEVCSEHSGVVLGGTPQPLTVGEQMFREARQAGAQPGFLELTGCQEMQV